MRESSSTVPSIARLDRLEQQPVAPRAAGQLAGVDPPARAGARGAPGGPGRSSHWMASVISSSPRADGSIAAHRVVDRAGRTGTRRRAPGPTAGRPASRRAARRRRRRRASAMPKRCGSGTCLSRICAAGGSSPARGPPRRRATNAPRSCSSRLSPRYITKSSSPRKSRAMSTQWARPSGASWGMYVIVGARTASRRRRAAMISSRGVADDDADLGDAGRDHGLDPVEQDRLVGDRHQLLGAGVGDRPQAGAGTAGEDQSLHD